MFTKVFGVNWKTTAMGYGVYITAALAVFKCLTDCKADCNLTQCIIVALSGLFVGTGLVQAKDAGVTGTAK